MNVASSYLLKSRALFAVGRIIDAGESALRRNADRRVPNIYEALSPRNQITSIIRECSSVVAVIAPLLEKRHHRVSIILGGLVDGYIMATRRIDHRYGLDGSDQLQETANLLTVVSHILAEEEVAADLSLRAINAQLAVSYVASGAVKLISPEWRSGRALVRVARTKTYGNQRCASLLERYPSVGVSICWATICGETLFPVIYLLPSRIARLLALGPHLFHFSIGVLMGLPRFYWSFTAAQPALSYVLASRKGN